MSALSARTRIDGLGDDDDLHGALGDDRIIGGAGNDLIDGGGNRIATSRSIPASAANYNITYLGADLFTIQDPRAGSPDGTDTLRGIEFFEFSDGRHRPARYADFIPVTGITPTAWGLTDNDADGAPDLQARPMSTGSLSIMPPPAFPAIRPTRSSPIASASSSASPGSPPAR